MPQSSDPTNLQLTFNLEKITASEVRRGLRTLPNKLSCGSDRISYQMIKEAGPGLVGPLVSLFNASLRLRKVPDEWRKSTIKPWQEGPTGPIELQAHRTYILCLQEQWRKSLTPGSLSIFKKIRFSTNTSKDSSGIIRQSHSSVS